MEIKEIEFEKLRFAYVTVKAFIESETYEKVESLETKIEADLGLSGDDNAELLEKFVEKFELDYKEFDYKKHFYSESELFDSTSAFLTLLSLSVWLPLKTIELLTFNKLKIEKPTLRVLPNRIVSDLTFRDLITWFLEKEYKSNDVIKYVIKDFEKNASC